MTRLSSFLVLVGFLTTLALAIISPEELAEVNRNAECDNDCWFDSFPGGSCTNDTACMCTQQKYREKYFCCMGKKCAPSVLPDSIKRQNRECEAKNKPFTFDAEAVCGIKLSTMVTSSASATGSASGTTSAASATTTSESTASAVSAITSAGPWIAVPTESQTTSAATATPTDNAAAGKMARWEVVAGLVVAAGMLG